MDKAVTSLLATVGSIRKDAREQQEQHRTKEFSFKTISSSDDPVKRPKIQGHDDGDDEENGGAGSPFIRVK